MSREEARIILRQEPHSPVANDDDFRCILCEGVIEHADHDVFYLTGYCRHCTEALDDRG